MNAIVFCGESERLTGTVGDNPVCLMSLAGFPLLSYILTGLARLCVTRIVMAAGLGCSRIREYAKFHLPESMVRIARCPRRTPADSLTNLAAAMHLTEPTGLLIVAGNCIFGTDLAGRTANAEIGILPYLVKDQYSQYDVLLSLEKEQVKKIGGRVATVVAGGSSISLRYVPRSYLGALRGIIVELTAGGAADAPYHEALRVLVERGYTFRGFDAGEILYAEINESQDLPFATKTALELQRRGEMDLHGMEDSGRDADGLSKSPILSRLTNAPRH